MLALWLTGIRKRPSAEQSSLDGQIRLKQLETLIIAWALVKTLALRRAAQGRGHRDAAGSEEARLE
ncbi:MAG: hypothetical protein A2X93_02245 [Deltaproteobacteria bacterium GWC2_56_8]|nr:MAG: hypothetical protein A2X99_00395 [Deltaproteobacteria bacterium GWB2_55_19]OGP34183.1 MAG: hypothetical protein A2X93_02245 [Deltaproteobacteria bacterium GWC2_56_8]